MFGVSPHYPGLHVCSTRSGSVVWCVAVCSEGGNGVAEDSWNAHIGYLEDEVKKIDERADKLEATIPDLENEQKKRALRELVKHL